MRRAAREAEYVARHGRRLPPDQCRLERELDYDVIAEIELEKGDYETKDEDAPE